MSPEKQQIAIAEACGFTKVGVRMTSGKTSRGKLMGCRLCGPHQVQRIPDYLNDLNAMHEAEMLCLRSLHRMEAYRLVLKEILAREFAIELDFCACAAHRAEAFLKTINKWEESNDR